MLSTQAFDVVVSDFNMPGPSGLEFLRRIRQDHRDMILVLITAYGTDALEEGVLQLGGGYITKPFEPSFLGQVIRGLIQGRETAGPTDNTFRIMEKLGKSAGSSQPMRLEGGYITNDEAPIKEPWNQPVSLSDNGSSKRPITQIFVVCDQKETAPVWGYILRQKGLSVLLEPSPEKAIDHWSSEIPDLVVIDVDISHEARMELYNKFRAVSVAPILLFLPAYHETQILEAYTAGVDEVVVKPISPPIFLATIMAWTRRSWTVSVEGLHLVKAGKHRLDPARRCMVNPEGQEIKLTNLEFRLLHLLMSRPGHVFSAEELVESIWGGYGNGDHVMLKNVVYRLRRKIEADPSRPLLLQTGLGGYSFQG
jgi:DNA-binding response OmpR family regulator